MIWWEDWGEYVDNLKALQEKGQTVKALENRPVLDHVQSLVAECITECDHEPQRFRKWCKQNRIDPDLIVTTAKGALLELNRHRAKKAQAKHSEQKKRSK